MIAEMTRLAPLERIRNAHCRRSLVFVPQAAHEIRSHISELALEQRRRAQTLHFAGCARADVGGLDGRHFQVLVVQAVPHTVIS